MVSTLPGPLGLAVLRLVVMRFELGALDILVMLPTTKRCKAVTCWTVVTRYRGLIGQPARLLVSLEHSSELTAGLATTKLMSPRLDRVMPETVSTLTGRPGVPALKLVQEAINKELEHTHAEKLTIEVSGISWLRHRLVVSKDSGLFGPSTLNVPQLARMAP